MNEVLDQIITHLEHGGKLNGITLLMHRDWKRLIDSTKVMGRPPTLSVYFEATRALIDLQLARGDLVDRWKRQMTAQDGPDEIILGSEPEKLCMQYILA